VTKSIAIIAGVVAVQVAEVSDKRGAGRCGQKDVGENVIGGFYRIQLIDFAGLSMQGEVDQSEGDLAPVESPDGGQLGLEEFIEQGFWDFFPGIAIVGGEAVEHLLIPDPVFEHLRGGLDKVTGNAGAGKALVMGAGQERVHGMAKLVE
jgi:hypothetical protein